MNHERNSDTDSMQKLLEFLFYEIHFSTDEIRDETTQKIVEILPWNSSLSNIVDRFSDGNLRISSRNSIPKIQVELVNHHLSQLSQKGHRNSYEDLEKGVYLLSLMGDPTADYQTFKNKLDSISFRLGELFELNRSILTDEVKVHLLSRVMHQEEGYNGNHIFYHNPENSYITKVVNSKFGIPITLSVLYMLVGHRLNLPLFGVNLPLHFMLSYESDEYQTFIDPFNGGVQLDKETCLRFLEANGYKDSSDYFSRASTLSILRRMYNNLILIFKKLGETEKEEILSKQLALLENKQSNFS